MSCATIPPMGSILYLHTLPTMGGDTIFASMYAYVRGAVRADEGLAIWDYFPQLRSGFRVQITDQGGPKESA